MQLLWRLLLCRMQFNTTQHIAAAHNSYLAFSFMSIANESLKIPTRNVEWRQSKHIYKSCLKYCLYTSAITNRRNIQNFRVISENPRINVITSCSQTTITLLIFISLKLLFTFLLQIIIIIIIIIITGTVFTIVSRKNPTLLRSDHLTTRAPEQYAHCELNIKTQVCEVREYD